MILCADDYGISDSVDDAVIELIRNDRLTATSCIVNGPHAKDSAAKLKKYTGKIDIGLHLFLTDGKPLTLQKAIGGLVNQNGDLKSFWQLTASIYFRKLNFDSAYHEILKQLETFSDLFGKMPDFIDGHKHVQQLPVIREALVHVIKHINISPYLRIAALPGYWLKNDLLRFSTKLTFDNMIINYPGTQARRLFMQNGLRCNRYLLGYFHTNFQTTFSEIFRRYVNINPIDQDIFFCHPGYEKKHRADCHRFLLSGEFIKMCSERNILLNRFPIPDDARSTNG
jgi:predicted glycoside hydrolase/deacetylase ChbG (UPF0249 family)